MVGCTEYKINKYRIIAIMAGRLRMSTEQCIDTYRTLAEKAFQIPIQPSGEFRGVFSSPTLEEAVRQTLADQGLQENELLATSPVAGAASQANVQGRNCKVLASVHLSRGKY
jgi:hypothetical protein